MLTIDEEVPAEVGAREALLDRAMGLGRLAKTSERLRSGRLPVLSLAAHEDGALIGSIRLWAVEAAGARGLLLLGPLAVTPERQGEGVGAALMRRALNQTTANGYSGVLLVGDAPYYGRFGFTAALTHRLDLPGPVDRHRFLGHELRHAAFAKAQGLVRGAGAWQPAAAAAPYLSLSGEARPHHKTVILAHLN